MNRHITILFLLTMMILELKSEDCIVGKILGSDGNPIRYATLSTSSGACAVCDSAGSFQLCADSFSFPLLLLVSSVNYMPSQVPVERTQLNLTVVLEPKVHELDEVLVTGSPFFETKSHGAIVTVNSAAIEEHMPMHVGEMLQTQAGFSQRSGYQAPLILRGLSGKRLLVLRNGNRRFSSYPAGFMSHTINIYDLSKIEVEKGAASVCYGSGAIAGVVNLVDKSPFEETGFNAKVVTGYATNSNEKSLLGSGAWSNGTWAVKTNLRYRNANAFHYPNGSEAEHSFYSDRDFFVTTGYRPTLDQTFFISADIHLGGPWGKPRGFSGTKYLFATTNHEDNNNFSFNYTLCEKGILSRLTISSYYSDELRELERSYYAAAGMILSFRETTYYSDHYYGGKILADWQPAPRFQFRSGAEGYGFHLSSPTESIDYIEGLSFRNRVAINARSFNAGIFTEATYNYSDVLKFTAGIRSDLNVVHQGDVHDLAQDGENRTQVSAFSGNVACRYAPLHNLLLKWNLSRSFRMPDASELFTDNYSSRGILYGNPQLNPEYSYSLDGSLSLTKKWIQLELAPFVWLIDGMITLEDVKGQPGTNFQYVNIGQARLWGGEATLTVPFRNLLMKNDKLNTSVAVAYMNGTDVSGSDGFLKQGEPLDYIPPFNMKSELNYSVSRGHYFSGNFLLATTWYTKQNRLPHGGYATPTYWLFDASIGGALLNWPCMPALRLVANNLLNTEYYSFQSYLPSEGRSIRMFLTLTINK